MNIPSIFKKAESNLQQSGVVASIFNFFQGRATAFAILFAGVGIRLAFMGKLDANYALFVTAIQGLIFAHSCKEDWHEQKMAELDEREDHDKNPDSGAQLPRS
jgi:hypothetical protein